MIRDDLHFDWVAKVGFVRPVPQSRIPIGNLFPILVNFFAATEFFENTRQNRLDRVKHVLLCDK